MATGTTKVTKDQVQLKPEPIDDPREGVTVPIPTRHGNLVTALAAFQAELPTIAKGNEAKVKSERTGGEYKYQYADLSDISPVVLRLLGKHGLAWSTKPTMMGGDFVLHYRLTHESGEVDEGIYPLPLASTPAQQLGSAITYARRYALCAVTGVAPGGDDDDAASLPNAAHPQQRPPVNPEQPPIPAPVLSADWKALADACVDRGELRVVYSDAEQAGELGLPLPGMSGMPVEAYLYAVREKLPEPGAVADPPMALEEPPVDEPPVEGGGWPVTQIPGAGS